MPVVIMPNGDSVNMPDNPTPDQVNGLRQVANSQKLKQLGASDQQINRYFEREKDPGNALVRGLKAAAYGAQEPFIGAGERIGTVTPQQVAQRRIELSPITETTAGKVGGTIGEAAPWVAGSMLLPGGWMASLPRAMASQGLLGGLQGLLTPTAEGESVGRNTGVGTALGASGGLLGYGLSRLLTPHPNVPTASLDLAEKARSMGVSPTTPEIMSQSNRGVPDAMAAARQKAYNQAASLAIGQPGDALTSTTLGKAYAQVKTEMNRLAHGKPIDLQNNVAFPLKVATLQEQQNNVAPALQGKLPDAQDILNELALWHKVGSVTPEYYDINRRLLSKSMRSASGPQQNFYGNVLDAMDEVLPNKGEWQAARNTYRNLAAIDKPGVIDAAGNIKPQALWNPEGGITGTGALNDIAQVGRQFPAKSMDTGFNAMANQLGPMLGRATLGSLLGGGATYAGGQHDPLEIAKNAGIAGTGALLGSGALNLLMTNPLMTRYLTQGLLGMANPALNGLNAAPLLGPLAGQAGAAYGLNQWGQ